MDVLEKPVCRDHAVIPATGYRDDLSLSGLNNTIKKAIGMVSDSEIEIDTVKDRPAIMQQYISSIKGKSIAVRYPNAVPEWDTEKNNGLTPEMVNATSLEHYWWKCERGHSFQSSPANKLGCHQGCPVCSNRRLLSDRVFFISDAISQIFLWCQIRFIWCIANIA